MPERPPMGSAEQLLRAVRALPPTAFAETFRTALSDVELMRVVAALPPDRIRDLATRAHREPDRTQSQAARPDRPLAVAIRTARRRAQKSQSQLGLLVGVGQSAVSQWERGMVEPSGLHMAELVRALPALAELLGTHLVPPTPAASQDTGGQTLGQRVRPPQAQRPLAMTPGGRSLCESS